jgi:D-alanine-D-alanine ligase
MAKLTVALLAGGVSSEREVSLNSGEQVYRALDKNRYDILRLDPATDLPELVARAGQIDVALIILHGPCGEDGTIQGLLDLLDIAYQGSGVLGSALAMNKLVSKRLYEQAGLRVPPYRVARCGQNDDWGVLAAELGLPLVIKPVCAGSSVGMSVVCEQDDLAPALELAFSHDATVLIEKFIPGREITGAVLGNDDLQALPLIEIIPTEGHDFFDYHAKYTPGASREICPAPIDAQAAANCRACALTAHRALGCLGYSRTDMMLYGGEVYVLETNTIPGMTATSLLPQAAAKAGISFSQLLDRLIQWGMEAHAGRRSRCR